jgi:spindle assembly abnormal protein 6
MQVTGQAVDQFDIASANTVFCNAVPVLLQRADREDLTEELSVRLLVGNTRHSVNMKVLKMHIFNDSDLLFLHTLEVSEEDFQTLKAEQGILVDFANFSGKIIDLLRRCIASRNDEVPKFRAVLAMSTGESVFKLVETNDFKQLAHISLCFRPGTDMAIKSFLAFRFTEVQQDCNSLRRDLANDRAELDCTRSALQEQRQQAKQAEAAHVKLQREIEATAKDAASAAMEERIQERQQLLSNFERCFILSLRCWWYYIFASTDWT